MKDLPKVHTWWLEWDSNLRTSGCKAPNLPLSHHAPQLLVYVKFSDDLLHFDERLQSGGKLHARSGSFSKLRASIRRSSAKLVKKLTTPVGPFDQNDDNLIGSVYVAGWGGRMDIVLSLTCIILCHQQFFLIVIRDVHDLFVP